MILDNCEHFVDACAELAKQLLQSCPHLKILATSREALGIASENVYSIPR
jgi:non-specific serine/threonine protein kinase